MANVMYNTAKKEIMDGTVDLLSDAIKVMLVNSTYTPNADDDAVDAGGASDPLDAEINATNYTGGWGGSGRKPLASKAITVDKPNDRAEFDAADLIWSSLGGAQNDTVVGAILIKEGGVDDTTSRLIAYIDFTDTPTNGGDFTIQWNAEGILQLA